MSKNILGIDLGTSSVKLLLRLDNGEIKKSKAAYKEISSKGWKDAIKTAFKPLSTFKTDAISLSAQVGTYIVNGTDVISWNDAIGKEELELIKSKYSPEPFIREIAMPHPDIISYPIPRLMYIKNNYDYIKNICQPKDLICKMLTGRCVTDKYSFRGLAHTRTGKYSKYFLDVIGVNEAFLPPIISHDDIIGTTTTQCKKELGIPEGIPVFNGLNDFFSSIVGMDIKDSGDMFDITGTSEHLGMICDSLYADTKMVSGVFFDKFIHYGVTASSGASLDFGIREYGIDDVNIGECLKSHPPIFTPYLNGERAPVFDNNARGLFFGINSATSKKDFAYSVLEGVVFSLYHIYENMGTPPLNGIKICGGASKNNVLNTLKAEMFNTNIHVMTENDTSALGAVCIAAKKMGCAYENINPVLKTIVPSGKFNSILKQRYNIYKNLYSSLKNQFSEFANIRKDLIL